jgi:hypothetical protein
MRRAERIVYKGLWSLVSGGALAGADCRTADELSAGLIRDKMRRQLRSSLLSSTN